MRFWLLPFCVWCEMRCPYKLLLLLLWFLLMLLLALMQVFQAVSRLVVLVELSKLLQPAVSIAFYSNKTSIGRAITFLLHHSLSSVCA